MFWLRRLPGSPPLTLRHRREKKKNNEKSVPKSTVFPGEGREGSDLKVAKTRSYPSSLSDNGGSTVPSSATGVAPAAVAPSYLEIKGWCGFRDRNTHGLTEALAREIITKLRQGIGPDLARVGAMRVRNTKNICCLKTPSLSSCSKSGKQ